MEAQILEGALGKLGKYDVEFKDGKLCLALEYDGGVADAGIVVKIDAESVLVALKNTIPGHFDDAIIDGAIALLKK